MRRRPVSEFLPGVRAQLEAGRRVWALCRLVFKMSSYHKEELAGLDPLRSRQGPRRRKGGGAAGYEAPAGEPSPRLYEQEPGEPYDSSRFGLYVKRWLRWLWAGRRDLKIFLSPRRDVKRSH